MKFSRRQFLRGSGAALALPILPSLLPRTAQAAASMGPKNFVGIGAYNGRFPTHGTKSLLMPKTPAPVNGLLPGLNQVALPGKYTIHSGSLTAMANGGSLSEIIDGSYTPYLKKMFMLQGFDYLSMGAAHHNAQFGAQSVNTGQSSANVPVMASIDHVIADFYRSKGLLSDVVAYCAVPKESTFEYSNSFRADGSVTSGRFTNPAALWEKYFGNVNLPAASRTLLVDRVLANYKSVRNNPRLGSQDRGRLDSHIELLGAAEARVKKIISGGCKQTQPPQNLIDRAQILRTMNDVIVSIMSCGLASVFMGWARALLDADPGTWHTWSHDAFAADGSVTNPSMYASHLDQNKAVMREMGLDLATKLDQVVQPDGTTLLDNTVILVIQEHNFQGHSTVNIPVIGFGSAGGAFATDLYADYRALAEGRDDEIGQTCFGFPMNQLYANVLQAMGMTPADYERLNKPRAGWLNPFKTASGYGCPSIHPDFEAYGGPYAKHYKQFFTGHDMSEKLPLVRT